MDGRNRLPNVNGLVVTSPLPGSDQVTPACCVQRRIFVFGELCSRLDFDFHEGLQGFTIQFAKLFWRQLQVLLNLFGTQGVQLIGLNNFASQRAVRFPKKYWERFPRHKQEDEEDHQNG